MTVVAVSGDQVVCRVVLELRRRVELLVVLMLGQLLLMLRQLWRLLMHVLLLLLVQLLLLLQHGLLQPKKLFIGHEWSLSRCSLNRRRQDRHFRVAPNTTPDDLVVE